MTEFKFFVAYGKQRVPKILPKGGVDFFFGKDFDLQTSRVGKIWKVPNNFTADQARFLIKKGDPRAQVVFDKTTGTQSHATPEKILHDLEKQYDPSCHFIQVYDARGREYNFKGDSRRLSRKTGIATESIDTVDVNELESPIVKVFGRGDSEQCGRRGIGISVVQKGKLYHQQKLK